MQGRIARSIYVDMQASGITIDDRKLATLQKDTEKLAYAFKHYLSWIIINKDRIIDYAIQIFDELREKASTVTHRRTQEIVNGLIIGFKIFLMFMTENKALTLEESQELEKNMYIAFDELIEEQTLELEELNPVDMFYSALEQLFISNSIRVVDYETGRNFNGMYNGEKVGFYNRELQQLFLFPDIIYTKIAEFYSKQGINFPIPKRSFWGYMYSNECLFKAPKQKRNDKKIRINKIDYTVVAIKNKNPDMFQLDIVNPNTENNRPNGIPITDI